jgi:alkanesulfonate monooxygenase SsuD/methylene tetrahydromethanopterin reductase-like flavin-dependent oxidoreductase (luciferase family)
MKVTYFQQAPYRHLPDDFSEKHEPTNTTPFYDVTEPAFVVEAYRNALDECMTAARAGFDAICVTEHAQASYDMSPNPDLSASAIAYATEVENIACGIYPVGRTLGKSREPLRVAEEQAMIDCISNGRLISGFPVGLPYDANINAGVPPLETRRRYDENLDLVLRAWTEPQPFPFNGKFTKAAHVNVWPRPVQNPRPPVWVTGIGNPNTMKMCLNRGFGFNYLGWFGAKGMAPRIIGRFKSVAEELGVPFNPLQIGFIQLIGVAETDKEARELYEEHIMYFCRRGAGNLAMNRLMLPGGIDIRGLEFIMRDPGDFGTVQLNVASYEELIEAGSWMIGSPETVRDQLIELATEVGIGNLLAMLQFGSMPTELAKRNIELFASKVMPELKPLFEDDYDHHWWPERLGGTPMPVPAPQAEVA